MEIPAILIVDDRIENIISLEEILDGMDVDIFSSNNGNDSVQKCCEKEFALILMDVQMPGMNGFESMKLIRNEGMNTATPVIFLSAIYSDDYHKIKGIQEGAVDFITKPIVEEILIGKIRIFLDMYRQKKTLQKQMKEIESLNRDMENFNRILVHDLKQPLSGILGMSEYILTAGKDKLSEDLQEVVEDIHSSGEHMTHIITDVVDLIKIKNENSVIEETSIAGLIHEIIQSYYSFDKKIQLITDNLPVLHTKKSLLSSIFRNLLSNSVKYNENNTVEISVTYTNSENTHVFYIKDNGIGIPENKIKDIFLPFVRGENGLKFEGTGIGLSIVSAAVEKLGGSISVHETGSGGTTFCVTVPVISSPKSENKQTVETF